MLLIFQRSVQNVTDSVERNKKLYKISSKKRNVPFYDLHLLYTISFLKCTFQIQIQYNKNHTLNIIFLLDSHALT